MLRNVAEFAKNFGAEMVAFRSAKDAFDHTFAERKATMLSPEKINNPQEFRYAMDLFPDFLLPLGIRR